MNPDIVKHTDTTFWLIFGISVFFLLIITVAMFYFIFKYSRKKNPVASDITGNTTLEILWTVIPTLLVLVMFFYGYTGFKMIRNAPENSLLVKVVGRMWAWSYEYENGAKSDTLYVPTGKPVKLELTSTDVNHSFYIPAFRIKEDAVPGRKNYMWFEPKEDGTYQVECAEYCGLSHAYMLSKIIAVPESRFNEWLIAQKAKEQTTTDTLKSNSN